MGIFHAGIEVFSGSFSTSFKHLIKQAGMQQARSYGINVNVIFTAISGQ